MSLSPNEHDRMASDLQQNGAEHMTVHSHIARRNGIESSLIAAENAPADMQEDREDPATYAPSSTGADSGRDSDFESDAGDYSSTGTPSLVSDDDTLPDMESFDTKGYETRVINAPTVLTLGTENSAFPGYVVPDENEFGSAGFKAPLSIINAVTDVLAVDVAGSSLCMWYVSDQGPWTPLNPRFVGVRRIIVDREE